MRPHLNQHENIVHAHEQRRENHSINGVTGEYSPDLDNIYMFF